MTHCALPVAEKEAYPRHCEMAARVSRVEVDRPSSKFDCFLAQLIFARQSWVHQNASVQQQRKRRTGPCQRRVSGHRFAEKAFRLCFTILLPFLGNMLAPEP